MDAITPPKSPQPVVQAAKREVSSNGQGKTAPSADQPTQSARPVGADEETGQNPLERAEQVLNAALEGNKPPNSRLKIEIDEPTGQFVYKAINNDSGETIKQYPQEEVLRLLAFFRGNRGGVNRPFGVSRTGLTPP